MRSYITKRDLAVQFLPNIDPRSATNRLMIWIKRDPQLMQRKPSDQNFQCREVAQQRPRVGECHSPYENNQRSDSQCPKTCKHGECHHIAHSRSASFAACNFTSFS